MKTQIHKCSSIFLTYIIVLGLLVGCRKNNNDVSPEGLDNEDTNIKTMQVASNFRYATVDETMLDVTAILNNGDAVKGVVFDVLDANPQLDAAATVIASGVTGSNGKFSEYITLPNAIQTVFVRSNYVGLIDVIEAPVTQGTITVNLNPSRNGNSGGRETSSARQEASQVAYTFLGTWNSQGVPNYLEPVSDVVDASFLADVNAALPEGSQVPIANPSWISNSTETDLILKDSADIWVTFVHEGAGWKNALGFFTYNIANPPTTRAQIANHTVIFPNVSYQGSGGSMISGQKVKIGTFSKNTGIGWFVVANGWNGSTVGNGNYIQYSNPDFNLEVNPAKRAHMVLLNAASRNRVLIGFEDMSREGGSDNDFNDALFYVTANPYSAIQSTNVVALPATQADSDNDGVYNAYDAYPTDPTRAYDVYFPSKSVFGTLCFEDLWPGMGDFDFNDLVVGYNIQEVMNGQNDVVEIKSKFLIRAIGASFRNGFGIEFPISSDKIANVTGQKIRGGVVSLGANNVEVNGTKASVIMWDNPESLIRRTGGAYYNTEMSKPKGTSDTVKVGITFSTPQSTSNLGAVPFNPFIFVNQIRDKEVHLPDYAPTAMAGSQYFGTSDDNSIPSSSRYYKTSQTLPFALNIPAAFDYPTEKTQITAAHLKFRSWAQSSGLSFADWYKNTGGYRNTANIYNK